MRTRKLLRTFASLAWLPLALSCGGASFDLPNEIKGLRVLAVQKTPPYPKPGETVDLKVLYWDGKATEDSPRDIDVQLYGCINPKGDLYYNCGLSNVITGDDGGTGDADGGVADGGTDAGTRTLASDQEPVRFSMAAVNENSKMEAPSYGPSPRGSFADPKHVFEKRFSIPEDIISSRRTLPGVDPYGLAYGLFTACAGHLAPAATTATNGLPIGCFDANDKQLGPDDFVLGYSAIYVYNDRVNTNPEIEDFLFAQASLKGSTQADDASIQHVSRCAGDRSACAKYPLKLKMDPAKVVEIDTDPNAKTPDGNNLQEQVWVAYYTTGGELKSGLRLVNDAQRGWNEENGTEFTAPERAGQIRIFAVLHDNRGGMSWAEGKIVVD